MFLSWHKYSYMRRVHSISVHSCSVYLVVRTQPFRATFPIRSYAWWFTYTTRTNMRSYSCTMVSLHHKDRCAWLFDYSWRLPYTARMYTHSHSMLQYAQSTLLRSCVCVGIVRLPFALRSYTICHALAPTQFAHCSLAIGHGSLCLLFSSRPVSCEGNSNMSKGAPFGRSHRFSWLALFTYFVRVCVRPFLHTAYFCRQFVRVAGGQARARPL